MTDESGETVVISGRHEQPESVVPVAGLGSAVVVRDNLDREALNEDNITAFITRVTVTLIKFQIFVQCLFVTFYITYLHDAAASCTKESSLYR